MQVLQTIFYILLLILCLSILVTIHELGHFIAAKIFKVYVFEFSIGFGPKLFSIKRKKGETYFSLRALPFGGYVSLYNDEETKPENFQGEIDESRSMSHIKKWKRAIILVAGVTMNVILALVLFFVSETAFKQTALYSNVVSIAEDSIAETVGLKDQDTIQAQAIQYKYLQTTYDSYTEEYLEKHPKILEKESYLFLVDDAAILTYIDDDDVSQTKYVAAVLDGTSIANLKDLSWDKYLAFIDYEDGIFKNLTENMYTASNKNINISFNVKTLKYDEENDQTVVDQVYNISLDSMLNTETELYHFENMGISFYRFDYYQSFGSALGNTFKDFGNSATAIVRGLVNLFTPSGIKNVGGIIAIGYQTSSVLANFGFGQFIKIWGMISVNLAIMNLLPFPSLDGWQLLVLIVEGVAHKEIPKKVKNIISIIGFVLLFALIILLTFKDFFSYVIKI